jgi:nucleoside-diphosphate-sugar epimerase
MSKVVVTGAAGYIGTQLVRDLLQNGHEVLGVDRLFFGNNAIEDFQRNPKFTLLKKDIRDLNQNDIKGFEIVCDLACLSNDPAGEIDPELTYQINRDGRVHVANISKQAGVEKYILSSSCSVYGSGESSNLTEESSTNPISVYAKSTFEAEQKSFALSDANFSVTALRNATVFGLSTRMRFDLVVNLMTISAFRNRRILVMGGGLQWRPLVHLSDVSQAFQNVINSEREIVNGEIFNIGLSNYQIKQIAYIVREQLPFSVDVEIAPDDADKRNYNVNFDKANEKLKFKPKVTIELGVREIYNALKNDSVDTSLRTNTVGWYKHILESKKLIDEVTNNGRII